MYRMKLFIGVALVLFVVRSMATVIYVPTDYTTIQAGINASSNGDTVLVLSGTYYEKINFNGHNIVLGSLFLTTGNPSYISETIVDGYSSGSVVTFNSGEDNSAVITGFTIQNGYEIRGGGIYCLNSNPVISYNIISGNNAHEDINWNGRGGGIYCNNSDPDIIGNSISGNNAVYDGGGICCDYSNPVIIDNIIWGNSTDYGYGGGICLSASSPTVVNNTITQNRSEAGGGISCGYNSDATLTNNIFWADSSLFGGVEINVENSSPTVTYCDIQGGWAGETNIDCDPIFCDPDNGSFYLDASSCCVGAGEGGVDIGALGVGCGQPIPTLSEWGLIVLALLILAVGTVAVIRSCRAVTAGE